MTSGSRLIGCGGGGWTTGGATNLDALAIALSYTLIIVMANALGVVIALTLHLCGLAAVGAPPVVQVVVDVLGITLTCLVCTAVLS